MSCKDKNLNVSVVKFGGSSIKAGKPEISKGIIATGERILNLHNERGKLVVVLSAYQDRTNTLVQLSQTVASHPDRRATDFLLSIGEQESVGLVGIYLRSMGCECELMTGWQSGIKTDGNHGNASIIGIDIAQIQAALKSVDVVLVTGFQGVTKNDAISTLGRGGSDTSAIALAVALQAKSCEILSDVSGIFSINPRQSKDAIHVPNLDFDSAMEMSSVGVKVIDPRAVEIAKTNNLEFSISHFSPRENGSTIVGGFRPDMNYIPVVASTDNITRIVVSDVKNSPGVYADLLEIVADTKIRIASSVSQYSDGDTSAIVFHLWESDASKLSVLSEKFKEYHNGHKIHLDKDLCAVSVVSRKLMQRPGIISQSISAINSSGGEVIEVLTGRTRITTLLRQGRMDEAAVSMHASLNSSLRS